MGQKLTKKQRKLVKEKHRKKRIQRKVSQDIKGISRKRYSLVIKPKTFFILKIIGVILIPVVYILYSPFLVLVMIYFVFLFFAAIGMEHSLNKSVIKSNHIKVPKFDSAIALLLVCVSAFGSIFSISTSPVGRFTNTFTSKLVANLRSFGTLLTGERSIFGQKPGFGFGMMEKPEGFIPNREALLAQSGGAMPNMGMGMRPNIELSIDDLPIEFMFGQILSTAATVLVFAVMVFAIISLIYTMEKISKFSEEQNLIIIDSKITILTDEELSTILDFGEIEVEKEE